MSNSSKKISPAKIKKNGHRHISYLLARFTAIWTLSGWAATFARTLHPMLVTFEAAKLGANN